MLSGSISTYSYQLLASTILISYLYLLYSHTPVRRSYQNPFVTNHYRLLVSDTPEKQPFAKLLQNRRSEKFCNVNKETPMLVSYVRP